MSVKKIDADALIQRIDKSAGVVGIGLEPVMAIRDIKALISAMPTVDAEPVVRCKDCRYYNGIKCERMDIGGHRLGHWYCADGERASTVV